MGRMGWFKESYRHGLSARGIKTKKFYAVKSAKLKQFGRAGLRSLAPLTSAEADSAKESVSAQRKEQPVYKRQPSPVSKLIQLRGERALSKEGTKIIQENRPVNRAISAAKEGQIGDVLSFLSTGKDSAGRTLTSNELETLRTTLNAYALQMAQSKNVVPDGVLELLDKNMKKRVEFIEEQNKREFESPLRKEFREDVQGAAIGAVDLAAEAPGAIGKGAIGEAVSLSKASGQVSSNPKDLPGIVDNIDELEDTPPFEPGTNVFIDDKGMFGNFDVPRSSESFQFEPLTGGGTNIALAGGGNIAMQSENIAFGSGNKGPKSYSEAVQKKVDSVSNAKEDLAKVDISAFEKGNKYFEKGDREGLIRSISELQSQEAKLKDRWNLLGQTHAQVQSVQNHESAFKEDGGSNFFFGAGSGARKLADQTEKLSDARGEILKSNNEVFARRKMLEFSLQRMDSVVPPENSVPKNVTRFHEERSGLGPMTVFKGVDNVAIKTLRGDQNV